ncbi:D-glycero-D-manno-heptose 1,7-bisphosphate phosphatase [uncultured Gammaproteobacteria bacterium]
MNENNLRGTATVQREPVSSAMTNKGQAENCHVGTNAPAGRPGLLLDRDGVVNIDSGYVATAERCRFLPGVFTLARRAFDRGFAVVIVTNQSGVARGYYTEEQYFVFAAWVADRFAAEGVPLAGQFHCPYHADAVSERYRRDSYWRKPNPGMIRQAARTLRLELARSVMLGDHVGDLLAARAAGVGVRVLVGRDGGGIEPGLADFVVPEPGALIRRLGWN